MINIKMYLLGFGALFFLTVIGSAYWYYSWSQEEIKILNVNNALLETAVAAQTEAIESMEIDALNVGKQIVLVSGQFREARHENNVLRAKLAKHDVAFLAEKKPGLIQKIVNKGTDDVGRCFEILSGAELTEQEKTATKKSQINSSCPDIANPEYEAKL